MEKLDLKTRFQRWSLVELKLYLKDLEEEVENNTINEEEKLCIEPIKIEIEKRSEKKW